MNTTFDLIVNVLSFGTALIFFLEMKFNWEVSNGADTISADKKAVMYW